MSDPPEAGADDCPSGCTRGADPEMPEGQDSSARPSVASPSMEPPNESLRRGGEGTSEHSKAHQPGTGTDRPCHGAGSGSKLPHVESSLQFDSGSKPGSLPHSVLFEAPGHMAPPVGIAASGSVATGPHALEAVQSETQSTHPATAEEIAFNAVKSMPHAEHCALLAPLSFTNDANTLEKMFALFQTNRTNLFFGNMLPKNKSRACVLARC